MTHTPAIMYNLTMKIYFQIIPVTLNRSSLAEQVADGAKNISSGVHASEDALLISLQEEEKKKTFF